MEYYECLEQCKKEFVKGYELGKTTVDHWIDEPIYPANEELYNEFVDEYGFNITEFVLYINRRFELNYDLYEA